MTTTGQKIYDFLFKSPTEESLGLPPAPNDPKHPHHNKEETIKEIHNALEHPINHQHQYDNKHSHVEKKKEGEGQGTTTAGTTSSHENKNISWGTRIKKFLFEAPTEENLGLPPAPNNPKHPHNNKQETMKEIHDALEHPINHHHQYDNNNKKEVGVHETKKKKKEKEEVHHDEHKKKSLGQKLKQFFFESPNEDNLHLAQPSANTLPHNKEEILHEIHDALEHPLSSAHHHHHHHDHTHLANDTTTTNVTKSNNNPGVHSQKED